MYIIAATVVLVTIALLLYWYFTKDLNYWKKRNIPSLRPFPIVGNILSVIREKESIGEFLRSLYETTSKPYIGFFLLNKPFLLIRDPEIINKILIKDFEHFPQRTPVDNPYDRFGQYFLLLSGGNKWKPMRTAVTSLFSTGKNKNMLPLINVVCERFIKDVNNTGINQKSRCRDFCYKYAADVITHCFLGIDSNAWNKDDSEFMYMTKKFSEIKLSRTIPTMCYFVAPFLVKLFRMTFLDPIPANFMHSVCLQALAERKRASRPRGDLIDILLRLHEQESKDPKELSAMFMQFLAAGFETLGNSMSYAIFELSVHQDVQTRLRNEIKDKLKRHGTISYEALQEMKYLDMVIKEISRKYPLLPFLDRRCVKTFKSPEHNLEIEEGIGVYISTFGLHYDPRYFPEPEKFDPERFSSNLNLPQCAFLPFGGGLRRCIGSRFATVANKMLLVKLLLNFHVDKCADNLSFAHNWIFLVPEKEIYVNFKPLTSLI